MNSWELALEEVTDRLNQAEISWMLVGSAATAIHGAAVQPGDVDILIPTAAAAYAAAAVLPNPSEQPPNPHPGMWYSTTTQPVLTWTDDTGTSWTFGRWIIAGTTVELANLDRPEPTDGVIETGAPQSFAIEILWHGRRLPVVPLELQIGTMIARDQQDRLGLTLAAADLRDLDADLLRRTVADRQIEVSDPRVPRSVGQLLGAVG